MNIYEKMQDIMQNVSRLQKDDKVTFGKTAYRALSEEKVTTIMRQQLIDHGLVVYPVRQTASRSGNITHVDVVYRMVNVEAPEEFIEIASCGDGADTQDKGSGKAMTYAFKYMWLRAFALPTGEDPDKISSAEIDARQEAERARQGGDDPDVLSDKEVAILQNTLSSNQIKWVLHNYNVDGLQQLTKQQYGQIFHTLNMRGAS